MGWKWTLRSLNPNLSGDSIGYQATRESHENQFAMGHGCALSVFNGLKTDWISRFWISLVPIRTMYLCLVPRLDRAKVPGTVNLYRAELPVRRDHRPSAICHLSLLVTYSLRLIPPDRSYCPRTQSSVLQPPFHMSGSRIPTCRGLVSAASSWRMQRADHCCCSRLFLLGHKINLVKNLGQTAQQERVSGRRLYNYHCFLRHL